MATKRKGCSVKDTGGSISAIHATGPLGVTSSKLTNPAKGRTLGATKPPVRGMHSSFPETQRPLLIAKNNRNDFRWSQSAGAPFTSTLYYFDFQATLKLDPSVLRAEGKASTLPALLTMVISSTPDPKSLIGPVTELSLA
jgi:hypothetical protein